MSGEILIMAGENLFSKLMGNIMGGSKGNGMLDGLGDIAGNSSSSMDLISGNQEQNSFSDTIKDLLDDIKGLLEQLLQQFSNQENDNQTNSCSSANTTRTDLGDLSAKYETGDRGPGTVSSGTGDAGGVSYGTYQMTSKNGGTVQSFVNQSDFPWKDNFKGLEPGSEEFTAEWKQIAADHPDEFKQCQHDYIKKTHYDPLASKIKDESGLDISEHSNALQDVIWSTGVQHGSGTKVVSNAIDTLKNDGEYNPEDTNFDEKLIKAIYAERGRKDANGSLVHFSNNSTSVQNSVSERFISEEKDALAMLENE